MITASEGGAALAQADPRAEYQLNGPALLAERANGEFSAWEHEGHEVTLERVVPFLGDPSALRWAFWRETCHVSQLLVQDEPRVR